MKNGRYVLIAVAIILPAFILSSSAQQEHWLRYHSASEVSLLGTGTNMQVLELSSRKPSEVKAPQFESDKPYFAKWTTPHGRARLSLDRLRSLA